MDRRPNLFALIGWWSKYNSRRAQDTDTWHRQSNSGYGYVTPTAWFTSLFLLVFHSWVHFSRYLGYLIHELSIWWKSVELTEGQKPLVLIQQTHIFKCPINTNFPLFNFSVNISTFPLPIAPPCTSLHTPHTPWWDYAEFVYIRSYQKAYYYENIWVKVF